MMSNFQVSFVLLMLSLAPTLRAQTEDAAAAQNVAVESSPAPAASAATGHVDAALADQPQKNASATATHAQADAASVDARVEAASTTTAHQAQDADAVASEARDDIEAQAADDEEEEVLDFDAEEQAEEQRSNSLVGMAAGAAQAVKEHTSLKLIVDLLADYQVGATSWDFHPNHVLVLAEAQVMDSLLFTVHISDNPLYYEAAWSPIPQLTLRAGKIFVPFGSNDFHHLIGGRVDEASQFLPEIWTDYGFAAGGTLYDGDYLSADGEFYVVNGFQGVDDPLIGAAQGADNNLFKGLGGRLKLTAMSHYKLTASLYYDRWDADMNNALVFYSLAMELSPGFLPWDFANLKRLRLRGEWSRGEIQLSDGNYQQGLLKHAYARAGFYTEGQIPVTRMIALRLRGGLLNPDNTVQDAGDQWMVEPAIIVGFRKVSVILAYQALIPVYGAYDPTLPGDHIYAKFFLMF